MRLGMPRRVEQVETPIAEKVIRAKSGHQGAGSRECDLVEFAARVVGVEDRGGGVGGVAWGEGGLEAGADVKFCGAREECGRAGVVAVVVAAFGGCL